MKKTITLLTAILFLTSFSHATVWTVNNYHGAADFTTLQDAINGASAGDTLYIEGSPTSYGNGTFDKQLVVIGTGYWLNENDITQAYQEHSQVGTLIFNTGSEGSEIQGLYIYGYYTGYNQNWSLIHIGVDNLIIKKNYIYGYANTYYTGLGKVINVVGDRSSIIIKQNWIEARIHDLYSSVNGSVNGIYFSGIPSNCIVSNNLIRAYKSSTYGTPNSIYLNSNSPTDLLNFRNNVMWGNIVTYYTGHTNNILVSGNYNNGLGDGTMHNICNGSQYPAVNNNQQNVDMSTVFEDYTKYIDNGYILATGSPAIGAGVNGGDCGAFGRDTGGQPYVLSGMPEIPAIFEATIPNYGTVSIPVNIKSTTHNENK